MVAGNAIKAGVRFLSYDQIKAQLVDSEVSLVTRRNKNEQKFIRPW